MENTHQFFFSLVFVFFCPIFGSFWALLVKKNTVVDQKMKKKHQAKENSKSL